MVYGIYRIYIYIYYVSANKMTKRRLLAAKRMFKKKRRKIQIDTYITYSTAKQIKPESKDIVGEKCIRNDNGVPAFNEEEKKKACK